jgi:hypothetical protein
MKESTPQLRSLCGLLAIIAISSITACQTPVSEQVQPDEVHGWRIDKQIGSVRARAPGETYWQLVHQDGRIRPGSTVSTSSNSLLILASADDTIAASGRSRFTLPLVKQGTARVRQDTGRIQYEIKSTPDRRFEVQTPYMATVVKGTTFVISVSRKEAQVRVIEGRVWVVGCNGDLLAEMTAGQVGSIAAPPGAAFEGRKTSATDLEQSTGDSADGFEPDARDRNSGAAATVEGMALGQSSIAPSYEDAPNCFVSANGSVAGEDEPPPTGSPPSGVGNGRSPTPDANGVQRRSTCLRPTGSRPGQAHAGIPP